jgi:hypothetical protein
MAAETIDHGEARTGRSGALKQADAAAAYDKWVREKVAASLADSRPNVPHRQVMDEMRALIDSKRKQQAKAAS